MKRKTTLCCFLLVIITLISSCSPVPAKPKQSPEGDISICCRYGDISHLTDTFIKHHPDFRYTISASYISVFADLDIELRDMDADIYYVYSDVTKYTQGEMSSYFIPYEELGIDVGAKIAKADIFPYIVDIGTRPSDNSVVGLSVLSTGGAFLYRRSIAKEVWGTDDPAVIKTKIAPGWDMFLKAAEDLKKKGYAILEDGSEIWGVIESSADKGWITDGKLYIDPKREALLDLYKELNDNGFTSLEQPGFGRFGGDWIVSHDTPGTGEQPDVFKDETWGDWAVCEPPVSFFNGGVWVTANKELANDPKKKAAVAELIEWLTLDCTEQGYQYYFANGLLRNYGIDKHTVASATVMEMSDGTLEYLGGQDMFDVFLPASRNINIGNTTEYDYDIGEIWCRYVGDYANGKCTRDEAIAAFKQEVKEQLGIDAW